MQIHAILDVKPNQIYTVYLENGRHFNFYITQYRNVYIKEIGLDEEYVFLKYNEFIERYYPHGLHALHNPLLQILLKHVGI